MAVDERMSITFRRMLWCTGDECLRGRDELVTSVGVTAGVGEIVVEAEGTRRASAEPGRVRGLTEEDFEYSSVLPVTSIGSVRSHAAREDEKVTCAHGGG